LYLVHVFLSERPSRIPDVRVQQLYILLHVQPYDVPRGTNGQP
jgi:hypothetical protein